MLIYDTNHQPMTLDRELTHGGEASIHLVQDHPDLVAKIYLNPITGYEQKLAYMIDHPPADPCRVNGHVSIAWPRSLLVTATGGFVGYLMPLVQNTTTLLTVFNPTLRARKLPNFNRRYLHRAARNLAVAMGAIHRDGYVVGDMNESNILVTDTALVTLIDTDSFQVQARGPARIMSYLCPVGKCEYIPPELQGKSLKTVIRQPEHDRFGLGVLIFQLLMEGNHPFRGIWLSGEQPPTLATKIAHGLFPYGGTISADTVAPPPHVTLDILHPRITDLVQRCFVAGHTNPMQRPSAEEWDAALEEAERALVQCHDGHYYSSHLRTCPVCGVSTVGIQIPLPPARLAIPAPPAHHAPPLHDPVRPLFTTGQWHDALSQLHPRVAQGDATALLLLAEMAEMPAVPLTLRLEAAGLLGTGDPRLLDAQTGNSHVGNYWCLIEAGPFWYGAHQDTLRPVTLPYRYHIARYPVTNTEYARFMAAGGYSERRWWTEQGWAYRSPTGLRGSWDDEYKGKAITQPRRWDDTTYNAPTQPVVGVSWFEVAAYCTWLTEMGHTAGWLNRDALIRLPTSLEWERAARHTDQRPDPWGAAAPTPEHANYAKVHNGPTPVGCFPAGAAVCGAQDMSGNVWEWTSTSYKQPAQVAAEKDFTPTARIVLRGGSWYSNKSGRTCGAWDWIFAYLRYFNWGFRVCWSLHS